jgi:hypothetical protein
MKLPLHLSLQLTALILHLALGLPPSLPAKPLLLVKPPFSASPIKIQLTLKIVPPSLPPLRPQLSHRNRWSLYVRARRNLCVLIRSRMVKDEELKVCQRIEPQCKKISLVFGYSKILYISYNDLSTPFPFPLPSLLRLFSRSLLRVFSSLPISSILLVLTLCKLLGSSSSSLLFCFLNSSS